MEGFLILIEFEDLKNDYQKASCLFTSRKTYNEKEHFIKNVPCLNFSCDKCRQSLKKQLFYNTIIACDVFSLDKHLVLTTEGKKFRNEHDYNESYKLMSKSWKKFKQVVQYKYGKFNYILFPRSQGDGYCHYHIISDMKYVPQKWLDLKRKKYSNMGYISIQQNVDIAEYLTKDFWKDSEYYIPYGKKHFIGSKEVKKYMAISGLYEKNIDNHFFQLQPNGSPIADQYYDLVNSVSGYPPPLGVLTEEFYKTIRKIDREKRKKFIDEFKDWRYV